MVISLQANMVSAQEIWYELNGDYVHSIQKADLTGVTSLSDLKEGYPSSWILEGNYISTKLTIYSRQDSMVYHGLNETLDKEPRAAISMLDLEDRVTVQVKYRHLNAVTETYDKREMNFSVSVVPDKEAYFEAGEEALDNYIKTTIIDKMKSYSTEALTEVTFVVNEQGQTTEVSLSKSSNIEPLDELIISALTNLPSWVSAKNAKGEKVRQQFVLRLSNTFGC